MNTDKAIDVSAEVQPQTQVVYVNGIFGRLPDGRTFRGHFALGDCDKKEFVVCDAVLENGKWKLIPKDRQFYV